MESEHCQISNLVNRIESLGCRVPERFAVVPENLLTAPSARELVYQSHVSLDVRSRWRALGLHESALEDSTAAFPFLSRASNKDELMFSVYLCGDWVRRNPTAGSLVLASAISTVRQAGQRISTRKDLEIRLEILLSSGTQGHQLTCSFRNDEEILPELLRTLASVSEGLKQLETLPYGAG